MIATPSPFAVHHAAFIVGVVGLAWLGFHLAAPQTAAPKSASYSAKSPPPTTVTIAAAEVFQKAFWKRPTSSDHILHAERREWQDKNGVSKWQWFIAVEPSKELAKHLITDNAFSLIASTAPASPLQSIPEWFPNGLTKDQMFINPGGSFRLYWNEKVNRLFATDSGGGFRAGAPEVAKPPPPSIAEGRLPRTSPPNPSPP